MRRLVRIFAEFAYARACLIFAENDYLADGETFRALGGIDGDGYLLDGQFVEFGDSRAARTHEFVIAFKVPIPVERQFLYLNGLGLAVGGQEFHRDARHVDEGHLVVVRVIYKYSPDRLEVVPGQRNDAFARFCLVFFDKVEVLILDKPVDEKRRVTIARSVGSRDRRGCRYVLIARNALGKRLNGPRGAVGIHNVLTGAVFHPGDFVDGERSAAADVVTVFKGVIGNVRLVADVDETVVTSADEVRPVGSVGGHDLTAVVGGDLFKRAERTITYRLFDLIVGVLEAEHA